MKCIQYTNNGSVNRVMDESAERLVREGKAKFVAKKVWKEQVRDLGKEKK